MNLCANCGVELDESIRICPLCGLNTGQPVSVEKKETAVQYPSDLIILQKKETRKHLLELTGVITFSAIAVCSIVDLVLNRRLSWSLYADTAVLAAWICLALILLPIRKYYIVIPGLLITLLSMLFLFDIYSGAIDWFFKLGLPVLFAAFLLITIIFVLWHVAHFRGFNILAFSFLLLSGFCIITEICIDKYLYGSISVRWSLIVAVSILPISLVLLFLHYRMKKGKRLDSYFHV
jgi:hypothetical protein